jgi:hypothetical protein
MHYRGDAGFQPCDGVPGACGVCRLAARRKVKDSRALDADDIAETVDWRHREPPTPRFERPSRTTHRCRASGWANFRRLVKPRKRFSCVQVNWRR